MIPHKPTRTPEYRRADRAECIQIIQYRLLSEFEPSIVLHHFGELLIEVIGDINIRLL